MTQRIQITAGEVRLVAEFTESETALALLAALPLAASGNRWGQEIYFSVPVNQDVAPDARAEMTVGELAYWAPGRAFCIFFGPTPASHGAEPRAASPVNPVGKVMGDCSQLSSVPDGVTIRLELMEE
mgnify:CR=1 FL=1